MVGASAPSDRMELREFFCLCGCFVIFLKLLVLLAEGRPLQPNTVYAAVHTDAVLPCAVGLSQATMLEWLHLRGSSELTLHLFLDGDELMDNQEPEYRDRTALKEDGSLTLRHVRRDDAGEYRCVFKRGITRNPEEAKVSLIVAELLDFSMKVQQTSARELEFECECSSWGLTLDISVWDVRGNVLARQTGSQVGPDNLHSAVVKVAEGTATGNVTLICRAEVSEVSLKKENRISFTDDFRHAASGGFLVLAIILFVVVSVGLVVSAWILRLKIKAMCLVTVKSFSRMFSKQPPPSDQPEETEYRDLDQMRTTGASTITTKGPVTGVDASKELAKEDLTEMSKYKNNIIKVGRTLRLHPALIAAVISKQSKAGKDLELGFGKGDKNCFGLMQINKNFHVLKGTPFSEEHIDEGTTFLIHLIKTMMSKSQEWTAEQQLKGALVGYIIGIENFPKEFHEGLYLDPDLDLDPLTPTKDFANDVIARAQFFYSEGYSL